MATQSVGTERAKAGIRESTERERRGTGLYGAPMCKGNGGDKAGNLELEPNQLKFCPHLMNWNSSIPRFHPRAVRIFN